MAEQNQTAIAEQLIRIENARNELALIAADMDLKINGDEDIVATGDNVTPIHDLADAFGSIHVRDSDDGTDDISFHETTDALNVCVEDGYYSRTVTKSFPAVKRAETTTKVNVDADTNELYIQAENAQAPGYLSGAVYTNKIASVSVGVKVENNVAKAYVVGKEDTCITEEVASGSYEAGVALSPMEGIVGVEQSGVNFDEVSSAPTDGSYYIAVTGSGKVNAKGIATIKTAGYIEAGSDSTGDNNPNNTETSLETTRYYKIPNGQAELSGGNLTSGDGSASATVTGANFSLTETSDKPTSGKYITATGSGQVSMSRVDIVTTEGYIDGRTIPYPEFAQSVTSKIATKYYTFPATVVDTQSGNAPAYYIVDGYKAWVDGNEVVGTMPNYTQEIKATFNPLQKEGWSFATDGGFDAGRVTEVHVSLTGDLLARLQKI